MWYDPVAPRTKRTAAGKAQRFLNICSLFVAAIVAAIILGAPPTDRQIAASGQTPTADQSAPAPSGSPASGDYFSAFNGAFDITITLSEAASEDPDMEAAAEGMRGEYFTGLMTLALDETGSGTLSIDQLFFSPENITVSPFINSEGVVSQNTLYGTLSREGMVLSIVCVCEENRISGFIWLDSDITHVEFLYQN